MKKKKTILIEVENKQLDALEDLLTADLSAIEKEKAKKLVLKLWRNLVSAFDNENNSNRIIQPNTNELLKEIDLLKAQIKKINFKRGIENVVLNYHEANYASAAADLIINPNPIEIHGTKAGKGLDFVVKLMDILIIKSDSRGKIIYLKEPIIPKDGGLKHSKIETNDQKLNFENLLLLIQKRGHHLIRINKSVAVNIYQYSLNKENHFVLNANAPKGFDKDLICVKTDSYFNSNLYHTRLMEIDRISKHHIDFTVNIKKIEEITRYKNSLDVT